MTATAIPVGQRDYSLTGADSRRAVEIGLASAEWYHSEVPRAVMKDLMKRTDGPAIRDTVIWFALLIGGALALARPHFVEDERMIANRTAQVARMVTGVPDPETLVSGLTAVAAPTGRRQLYGALCQQYVNLRTAGAEHRTALDRLRESYGAQDGPDPGERSTTGADDPRSPSPR